MLPETVLLRKVIEWNIKDKEQQGFDVTGCVERLRDVPDSYDALVAFAHALERLPVRAGWPHVEPLALPEIWQECDPARPTGAIAHPTPEHGATRAEAAFLGSVCGCILGKPLEIDPTLAQLREAFTTVDAWPIRDYVPAAVEPHLKRVMGRGFHWSWTETVRERIRYAAPDDDINYTVIGMLNLERNGIRFSRKQLLALWLDQLPVNMTFGPERMMMVRGGQSSFAFERDIDFDALTGFLNSGEERCGAVIRADAYGYACPGRPALAAELAWRDASMTHRRTGVYGTMFAAALMATASVVRDRRAAVRTALQFVPRRSRFHKITEDCLRMVESSHDWLEAYERIHARYAKYGHCQIYQEAGTLINTFFFATDVGDGICKQVMQGCDTDSFGCTAGSLLGVYFGPGYLDPRWLKPFNDDLHTALAQFYERSLAACARRMGRLPALVDEALKNEAGPSEQPAAPHSPQTGVG
jgi:ADP-ribosylglycohydrolase